MNAPCNRLSRKLYAGNPHVRFDEGEDSSLDPLYSTKNSSVFVSFVIFPFGDLYRFLKSGCLNEPVTCDPFLGFRERAVRHTFSTENDLAFRPKLMPTFHFSLIAHSFEPGVELFHGILCIFRREPFIEPGASADH